MLTHDNNIVYMAKVLVEDLPNNMMVFGNKGNVWGNTAHIYQSGVGNLCKTPALSNNWAWEYEVKEIGCPKCIEIFKSKEV
jgi:hypothetical protein